MKTKLHRGLFEVIKKFLLQSCPCKEKALFQYCKWLERTRIWPLEEWGSRKSIKQLLDGLKLFRYVAPSNGCSRCNYDIGSDVVKVTSLSVEQYFNGLCLSCMDSSKMSSRDMDAAYWQHNRQEDWDFGCPFAHGQPTWYFSFMGRKAEMDAHKERERERKRGYWYDGLAFFDGYIGTEKFQYIVACWWDVHKGLAGLMDGSLSFPLNGSPSCQKSVSTMLLYPCMIRVDVLEDHQSSETR